MSPIAPTTVAELIGGTDPDRARQELEHALHRAEVAGKALAPVGRLEAAAFALLDQRVAEALQNLLAIDLGGLLLAGWRKYRELVAAAERTRHAPGHSEDVVLADHEITSTHHPSVEVVVDGSTVTTLTFDLTVSLELRSVIAIVQKGLLVALRCGDVVARARLSLWDGELVRGEARCVVGAVVRLGDGVAVAPAAVGPTVAATPPPWWERVPTQRLVQDDHWSRVRDR